MNKADYLAAKDEQRKRASRLFTALATVWIVAWLAMWGAYNWEPLRSLISVEALTDLSRPWARHPAALLIVAAAYFCSVFVVFPRPVLTLTAVVVFGPWLTFFSGISGLLIAALCGLWIGRKLRGEKLDNLTRSRPLRQLEEKLRRGGVGAVVVVRLVPVAPFTVVNIIFGALRIPTGDFLLGTFLALLPGLLVSIFVGDRLRAMIEDPGAVNLFVLALQMVGAAVVVFLIWRIAAAKFKKQ